MILVHGDNSVGSRNFLNQKKQDLKKQGFKEIITLEGKKTRLEDILGALEAQSLFGAEKYTIIENFFSRPKSQSKAEIEAYLKATNPPHCLLWEAKKATPAQIKQFPKAEIQEFKSSSQTFQFLDSLGANRSVSNELLHKALEVESAGSLFFMWARQVRLLLQCSDSSFHLPPWQKQKLVKQSQLLGETALKFMHAQLLIIDEKIKTGKTFLGLSGELELLLAKLYDKTYEKV